MDNLAELISTYGFPIVACIGMGYFIYYIWDWTTNVVEPALDESSEKLVKLIDRVRMLDNDLIRLDEKLHTIIEMRKTDKENKNDH